MNIIRTALRKIVHRIDPSIIWDGSVPAWGLSPEDVEKIDALVALVDETYAGRLAATRTASLGRGYLADGTVMLSLGSFWDRRPGAVQVYCHGLTENSAWAEYPDIDAAIRGVRAWRKRTVEEAR